jgi:hypothetical protein
VWIGLSSVRATGFVFTPYKRKKYPELQKKSAGAKKIHVYRCSRLQEWRLAPMLIKTNPVKIGGKKLNKKPATQRNLAADRKERLCAFVSATTGR